MTAKNLKALNAKLKAARSNVHMEDFGTQKFEDAMVIVRALCEEIDAASPKEEFCSVDSGVHRTRYADGRIR